MLILCKIIETKFCVCFQSLALFPQFSFYTIKINSFKSPLIIHCMMKKDTVTKYILLPNI